MTQHAHAIARLRALLGADRVLDHALERGLYARDGSVQLGDCGLVALPETTEEVRECMRICLL